jgi:Asp-tRNA(Asn)/Glu-tRNA(Gln) amidotransferase B subunit
MVETGAAPGDVVDRRGLRQISDEAALAPVVARVIEAHPDKARDYRDGRTSLMGFFMGQVMRETGGKASPELARRLIEAGLRGR